MDRGPPWFFYGWGPYWNQNQQPQPWCQWNPYWNQVTSFSNVCRNVAVPQSGGRMGPPSHNSSRPLDRPPTPRPPHPYRGVSLGGQNLNSSRLHKGRDLLGQDAGKGLLGPGGDPSSQRRKTPFLPPKKRVDFKSPKLHSQHWNGSDDNSSKWAAKQPLDPVRETPDPPPASSTKTGLGSHVRNALSSPPRLESSNVDVSMTQRNDQGDVLGLGGYIKKKRLLSKTSLADVEEEVEEEVKVTRKKTRLGWGQGLAKHEKQLKELNGEKPVPDGDNGETANEAIAYTATASASSDRPSPTPGSNVDPGNNNANTKEMMVSKVAVPESSRGCSLPIGGSGYRGNSSTSLSETVIRPAELSDLSRKHCLPPYVGGKCNPCNSSSNMTETVTCASTVVPSSSHGLSPSPGDIDDQGNIKSLAEIVIFPEMSTLCHNPLPGGNSDPCNSSTSMTETVVSELASSHGCDPPPVAGDSGSLGERSMRLTEILISPAVSAMSHRFSTSPPPAGGGNSDISNSSMSMIEGMACPPSSSDGYSLPTGANNGVHGHDSMNLLTEKVVRPADMPPPSRGCARSPAAGDNGALGNSNTSLTAAQINADTALASCDGCNLPPDSRNAKSTNVQDIPHKLILQPSNKIQQSARMPAIILRKLRTPRKFLKKNNLFEEPQASELRGSRFKARSQEEKDIFSEKLTTFGTDFTKISSFLPHKTPADCSEYYSKDYKSECSKKGSKRLPTSQEQCNNVNDAAPYMSGIATVTATKNYKRMKTVAEHMKKPANHESVAHLQSHSLPDMGHHVESSIVENEHVTGKVLVGEMNVPSLLGMNSPITNSDQAISLTNPKTEAAELKNLNDSCSNEEIRKGEQEIWTNKERCRLNQAIVNHGLDFASISVHVGTKSIQQCRNFLGKCKNGLNLGDKLVNNNVNSTISINDKSVSNMDSATCVVQSYSMAKENLSQLTSTYHGDAENYLAAGASGQGASERITSLSGSCQKIPNVTIESNQIISGEENHELCTVPEECNDTAEHSQNDTETNSDIIDDSIAPSEMESLRSDNNIATDGAEISGHHEFVQPPEDSEAFKIGSKENNDRAKKDEKNPDHSIASKEDSGIQLGCIVNSQKEKENLGTISSLVGNDLSASPTQDSDGASKNIDMPPSTAPATLQAVYAKFYRGEVVDLNIPPDVAPADVVSLALDNNRAKPSMDPSGLLKTTEATAIIRARETTDLGGDSEPANHVNHVQEAHQSQTTITETSHRPANQSGCIMLFGQVIHKAPYSGTSFTCSQGNQTVLSSSDMPSDTVVPLRARGGKLYFSGPNVWRSTPIYSGQQSVLSNTTMPYSSTNGAAAWLRQQPGSSDPGQQAVLSNSTLPYGSTNVAAAWPQLRLGSNALVNMSQAVNPDQQAVLPNTRMPHRSTNGALSWLQLQPGSSALVNMNQPGNPGHQAVLPNTTMPQGLTNGTAAWLQVQPGSSAVVNSRQQKRHVHMTSYSTTRGGVPYHLWQDSSSSGGGGLINFNNFNPGQQHGPSRILDTSSVVTGNPIQNQAPPTGIIRSGRNNIEGASTSNTGVAAAEKRSGRARQNS